MLVSEQLFDGDKHDIIRDRVYLPYIDIFQRVSGLYNNSDFHLVFERFAEIVHYLAEQYETVEAYKTELNNAISNIDQQIENIGEEEGNTTTIDLSNFNRVLRSKFENFLEGSYMLLTSRLFRLLEILYREEELGTQNIEKKIDSVFGSDSPELNMLNEDKARYLRFLKVRGKYVHDSSSFQKIAVVKKGSRKFTLPQIEVTGEDYAVHNYMDATLLNTLGYIEDMILLGLNSYVSDGGVVVGRSELEKEGKIIVKYQMYMKNQSG